MATGTFNGLYGSSSGGQWGYYGGSTYAANQWGYIDYTGYGYKVRGKFTVPAPATNYKISTITLTFSVRRNGASNLRGYLYTSEPTTTSTIPGSSIASAATPGAVGTDTTTSLSYSWARWSLTFNVASQNWTTAKTLYVWLMTNSNISGSLTEIGDGYASSSRVSVSTAEVGYSTTWTVSSNNTNYGTVSGGGTFTSGTITLTATPKAGYKFDGWTFTRLPSTGAGGSTSNPWSNGASNYFGYNYTAVGTFSAATYTITLNKNGGSGGTNSVNIVYGTGVGNYPSITLPSKTGYNFTGYYSATSGGTQWYNSAGNSVRTFNLTANATWYAQWSEKTATLSFNMVNGSGGPSAITMKYTTATTIPASSSNPTRSGYTFMGWATSTTNAYNGTVNYAAGATYKAANVVPTAATLYAVWKSTLTYNANNGSGAPSAGTMYYTPAFSLSTTKPSRTGYDFGGWNTNTGGTGTNYASGASYKAASTWASNATLYAKWTEKTATLSFNMESGSGGPSSITMKYTAATTIPAASSNPTRSGYTFMGWATSDGNAKAGTVAYTAGQTYKAANVVPTAATLYAVWKSTLTYNANGGSGAPSAQAMYYTAKTTLSSTKPTRTGYTFSAWNTASNGSGTDYAVSTDIKAANTWKADTTIYAKWTNNTYTISYNLVGGQQASGNNIVYESTVNGSVVHRVKNPTSSRWDTWPNVSGADNIWMNIEKPTKAGYTFNGWTISGMDTNSHKAWSSTQSTTLTSTNATEPNTSAFSTQCSLYYNLRATAGTVTFTANWTTNTYSISYTLNGGTHGTNHPTSATYDTDVQISNPTRMGYIFAGWTVSGIAGGNAKHGTAANPSTTLSNNATGITSTYFRNLRTTSGTVTFAAAWTPITYNVEYALDGGTQSIPNNTQIQSNDQTYTYILNPTVCAYDMSNFTDTLGSTNGINHHWQVTAPTKIGYTFTGWTITNMSANSNQFYYSNTDNHFDATTINTASFPDNNLSPLNAYVRSTSGTVTYTANYTANTYTISYVLNGGTAGSNAPTSATYDQYITIDNPTRFAYDFVGWTVTGMTNNTTHYYGTTTTDSSNSTTTATTITTPTTATQWKNLRTIAGQVTFTAVWSPKGVINFYNNGSWHAAQVYVHNGVEWVMKIPEGSVNGVWKIGIPWDS